MKLKKNGDPKLSGGKRIGSGPKEKKAEEKRVAIFTTVRSKNAKKGKEIIDKIVKGL